MVGGHGGWGVFYCGKDREEMGDCLQLERGGFSGPPRGEGLHLRLHA